MRIKAWEWMNVELARMLLAQREGPEEWSLTEAALRRTWQRFRETNTNKQEEL